MSRIDRMSRGRKTLLSLLLVGVVGTVASIGTYSAFSATTVNPGDSFAAGTVVISDNDANAAMYTITGAKPNDVVTRCIRVTYTGSLPATGAAVHDDADQRVRSVRHVVDRQGHHARRDHVPELHGLHARRRPEHLHGHAVELRHRQDELRDRRSGQPGCRRPVGQQRHRRVPLHADDAGQRPGGRRVVGQCTASRGRRRTSRRLGSTGRVAHATRPGSTQARRFDQVVGRDDERGTARTRSSGSTRACGSSGSCSASRSPRAS